MYDLPTSFEESFEHYRLPESLRNVGIMSDTHIPYHNIPAIEEAINYFISKKVDSIFLNGDIIDCYQLSVYNPDPRMRHFKDEIEAFKEFITSLQKNVTKKIYFKLGNHCERYEKIMIQQAPEFLDIPQFEFSKVLGCDELGVEVIKDQRIVDIGKLPAIHGHEVKLKSVSVNPARSLFLKTHATSICSHLHRTSTHTEPSLNEDIICWSTGHLSDEHPKYARINKWNHGVARVEKNEDGDFEVINIGLKRNKLFAISR